MSNFSNRIATLGSKDAVLVKKIQRKKTRSSCEQKRQEQARQYQDITSSSATLASHSDDSCCSESDCDDVTVKALRSVQVQNHIDGKK